MIPSAEVVFHVKHFAPGHRGDKRGKEARGAGTVARTNNGRFRGLCFSRSDANMLDRANPD